MRVILMLIVILLNFGCDKVFIIPFGKENIKTINTECGSIILKLTRLGSGFQLSSLLQVNSCAKVYVKNMKILIDNKEVRYDYAFNGQQSQDNLLNITKSGQIIYEFIVPYDEEKKSVEISFTATPFILADSDTCSFGPITSQHTW